MLPSAGQVLVYSTHIEAISHVVCLLRLAMLFVWIVLALKCFAYIIQRITEMFESGIDQQKALQNRWATHTAARNLVPP
jgi:hypothetical protein